MPIHYHLTFPLMMTIASVGAVLSIFAARHSGGPWFVPLWSRKQDSFTGSGWRYRTWSVWCGYIFISVAAADQLFG